MPWLTHYNLNQINMFVQYTYHFKPMKFRGAVSENKW